MDKMVFRQIIEYYVHPFIIYVLLGTLISYLLCRVLVRLGAFRDARWRAMVYSIPFIVPFVAYFLRKPLALNRCFAYGNQPGITTSWICAGGNVLAAIFTPLFIASVIFAVARAALSLVASRRFIKKYGFADRQEHVRLFSILNPLCRRAGIDIPEVVVTPNLFARAFTFGYRRPVIVLSSGLIGGLDDEELETVLAHELGHIVRGDSLFNWIMVFLRDIMFFTPLIFFIFRDYTSEKEKASDDYAIMLTNKPMAFAQALIKVWRMSRGNLIEEVVSFPGFVSHAGILDQRVERLVNGEFCLLNNRLFAPVSFSLLIAVSLMILYYAC